MVSINAPIVESRGCGRPVLRIDIDQVEMLRQVVYSWKEISDAVGVSRSTLWRCLQEQNLTLSSYSDISDSDLDTLVQGIQHDFPNAGLVIVQGRLQSMGIQVEKG